MTKNHKLPLAHFWVSFGTLFLGVILGAWQMWERSPLPAPLATPQYYYLSVTAHGVIMAYVMTTFFIMGFGYVIAQNTLGRGLVGYKTAWAGYYIAVAGVVMTVITILMGKSSVLFTFYPPLMASFTFYLGIALVFIGSWIWAILMLYNMTRWKRDNPGRPVPLAMFGIAAAAILWLWSSSGAAIEVVFILIPYSLGLTHGIDASLARTLFSVTLHAIVYFWLIPAYIAFYVFAPFAAGGRLYSDKMGRIAFLCFVIFGMPVGLHHLLTDPEHGGGLKFLQSTYTFMVALPTFLTVFTITASMEVSGRIRGGKGLLGWVSALPWKDPMVLATAMAFIMLLLGGYGGLVNMSFQMNTMIHNTQFVTAHFHLIFGGTTVLMYFAIAYYLWPSLTGNKLRSRKMARWQLWLWFIGMLTTTIPWHIVGLMGQPRRMSTYDYTDVVNSGMVPYMIVSVIGGAILLVSITLFITVLWRTQFSDRTIDLPVRFALSVNPPRQATGALNGFAKWQFVVLFMMLVGYALPIGQFFINKVPTAVGYAIGYNR